jgi:hypothetical protein
MNEQTMETTTTPPTQPADEQGASSDGGYLTLALATAALVIAGLAGYKVWFPSTSATTCFRTIDMPRLTKFMIADMMDKTSGASVDAADATYRTRLNSLDNEVVKQAGGCLLVRRDALVMPDPAIDITAQVARSIGLDLSQPETRKQRDSAPVSLAPVSTTTNEPGAKLD